MSDDMESIASIVERTRAASLAMVKTDSDADAVEKRREEKRADLVLSAFGVPRRIRENIKALDETPALKATRKWIGDEERRWVLVLCADKGLGKSTAAGWWLGETSKDTQPGPNIFRRWWPANEICAVDFYGDDMRRIGDASTLVIDDLGTEYSDAKGAFAAKLDRIMDCRYREYRRTIITTNLTGKAMAERYDQRVIDRLREGAVWATITGQSMRRGE